MEIPENIQAFLDKYKMKASFRVEEKYPFGEIPEKGDYHCYKLELEFEGRSRDKDSVSSFHIQQGQFSIEDAFSEISYICSHMREIQQFNVNGDFVYGYEFNSYNTSISEFFEVMDDLMRLEGFKSALDYLIEHKKDIDHLIRKAYYFHMSCKWINLLVNGDVQGRPDRPIWARFGIEILDDINNIEF